MMAAASFAEMVSIGSVLPFLGALMAPERVFGNPLLQPIILSLNLGDPYQLLHVLTIFFIMAVISSAGLRVALLWAQTRLSFAIGSDFSIQIYKKTLYQPYPVHIARNSSQIITGISTKTNTVIYSFLLPALFVVSSSLILLAILIALIMIDPLVALGAFGGFGTLYGLIVFGSKKRLARNSGRISQESIQVIKALQEGLGGIRDVLIDGTQSTYCEIYRAADLALRKSQADTQIIAGAPRFLIESLGIVLIAILSFSLAVSDTGISSSIPILGALALGAQRLLPVLQQLYSNWTEIRGGQASLQDVLHLLDQKLPEHAEADLPPVVMPFTESIKLRNVSFRYNGNAPWTLRKIDLEIPKGSRVGFVGATGSGKSTLIDIVMGLLQPNDGMLSVDGVPITMANNRSWQAHIAHVPQSIFLADSTVAENIAFGISREKIDYARVRLAARQAQIDHSIESWKDQYDTRVGERGVLLSGGQRQRIGIARALYKRANVIVLDEATSALDNETESAVMKAIDQIDKSVTVLIVAHRHTTLKNCDLILELKQGAISRIGTFKEMKLDIGMQESI